MRCAPTARAADRGIDLSAANRGIDQSSLPFAAGEGEGWGGVACAGKAPPPDLPLRCAQGEEKTPAIRIARRYLSPQRILQPHGGHSLPLANGQGKGWGGVRSRGDLPHPLPTSPCAARKGRRKHPPSAPRADIFPLNESFSRTEATPSLWPKAKGRAGEGFGVAAICLTPSQPPPALRARGGVELEARCFAPSLSPQAKGRRKHPLPTQAEENARSSAVRMSADRFRLTESFR
jgi:hypothetical protein